LTRILPELRRFGGTLLETPIERAIVARFRGSQLPPADHAADAG
jgi:hypothetical protein